jgi:hypothetical protein
MTRSAAARGRCADAGRLRAATSYSTKRWDAVRQTALQTVEALAYGYAAQAIGLAGSVPPPMRMRPFALWTHGGEAVFGRALTGAPRCRRSTRAGIRQRRSVRPERAGSSTGP